MPNREEVVSILRQHVANLIQNSPDLRLREFLAGRDDNFYNSFADKFITASEQQIESQDDPELYMMSLVLHRASLMDGLPQLTIAGQTLAAEAQLSLNERVKFAFHVGILRQRQNIFADAGIERIINYYRRKEIMESLNSMSETNARVASVVREQQASAATRATQHELLVRQIKARDDGMRRELGPDQRLTFKVAIFGQVADMPESRLAGIVVPSLNADLRAPSTREDIVLRDNLLVYIAKVSDRRLPFVINQAMLSDSLVGDYFIEQMIEGLNLLKTRPDYVFEKCLGYSKINDSAYEVYQVNEFRTSLTPQDQYYQQAILLNFLPRFRTFVTAVLENTPLEGYDTADLQGLSRKFPEFFNAELLQVLDQIHSQLQANDAVVKRVQELKAERDFELLENELMSFVPDQSKTEQRRREILDELFIKHGVDQKSSQERKRIEQQFMDSLDETTLSIAGKDYAIKCPITLKFMVDPVKLIENDGRVFYFEKDDLYQWLKERMDNPSEQTGEIMITNPLTRSPVKAIPQEAPELRAAIANIMEARLIEAITKPIEPTARSKTSRKPTLG